MAVKPIDQGGISLIDQLVFRGNEALQDTLDWLISQQKRGLSRAGYSANSGGGLSRMRLRGLSTRFGPPFLRLARRPVLPG